MSELYDTPCAASVVPSSCPVSLLGKSPLGIDDEEHDRSPRGSRPRTPASSPRRAITQSRLRSYACSTPLVHALGGLVEAALRRLGAWRAGSGCESIGVSVSDTNPDTRIATPIVTANSWNSFPMIPPMKRIGMNTAASDSVIETIVNPTSVAPVDRRLQRRFPHLQVADDVLEHHDRVVHHEAHGERERHERQVVEAVVRAGTSPRTCR